MSFFICHIQKFKSGDLRGIQIHNQRESKNSINKDIDTAKTCYNYDLINKEPINYKKTVEKRINSLNLAKKPRKDATTMVNVLVTASPQFFNDKSPQQTKQFFIDNVEFLKQKYGSQNLVSAVVHMDEKTPHMHLSLVPITNDGRLCAKEIFNRHGLQDLQNSIAKNIGDKWELKKGEKSSKKHIDIHTFKKVNDELEITKKQLKNIKYQVQQTINNENKIKQNFKNQVLKEAKEELTNLEAELTALEKETNIIAKKKKELEETPIIKEIKPFEQALQQAKIKNKWFSENTVTLTQSKFELLQQTATQLFAERNHKTKIIQEKEDIITEKNRLELQKKFVSKSLEQANADICRLKSNLSTLRASNQKMTTIVDEISKISPETLKIANNNITLKNQKQKNNDWER